jgi:DNA-binding MarR family transcriptional regulator
VTSPNNPHIRQILDVIEREPTVSQRSLASRVGIALGLTNLLLKRLVIKGWVRVVRVRRNRVRYLLTPTGIAEKARMSRAYLQYSIHFYADARDRIRETFATLSRQLATSENGDGTRKRIVFYGAGEVAEIGFVCLQETDLDLVAVIDDSGRKRFFNVPVRSHAELRSDGLEGAPFDRLVVMSLDGEAEGIRAALARTGFPEEKTFWI